MVENRDSKVSGDLKLSHNTEDAISGCFEKKYSEEEGNE